MNFAMWGQALRIIPRLSKPEWDRLDVVSKWLIATRAAVLIMTFISAAIAGIFAFRDGRVQLRSGGCCWPSGSCWRTPPTTCSTT